MTGYAFHTCKIHWRWISFNILGSGSFVERKDISVPVPVAVPAAVGEGYPRFG
jgi:hypothetical protein